MIETMISEEKQFPMIFSAPLLSLRPMQMLARGRAAHAQAIGKRRDDHDERKADAYAGQRRRSDLWDMADIHAVDHVIQCVDHL